MISQGLGNTPVTTGQLWIVYLGSTPDAAAITHLIYNEACLQQTIALALVLSPQPINFSSTVTAMMMMLLAYATEDNLLHFNVSIPDAIMIAAAIAAMHTAPNRIIVGSMPLDSELATEQEQMSALSSIQTGEQLTSHIDLLGYDQLFLLSLPIHFYHSD